MSNPLQAAAYYVNPLWRGAIDEVLASGGVARGSVLAGELELMRSIPSAYWIDRKAKIRMQPGRPPTESLEGILRDAAQQTPPPLVTLILYDLPNRDCAAKASQGEICCTYRVDGTCDMAAPSDCAAGLREYEDEYVRPFAQVLAQHASRVPVVVVLEPDSLPNLVTNANRPSCGAATHAAYTRGIARAVELLHASAPTATLYLDAGHGGWLGWEEHAASFGKLVCGLGVTAYLRGFSTNVANYNALGAAPCPARATDGFGAKGVARFCQYEEPLHACCADDACGLIASYSGGPTELTYAQTLTAAARGACAGFEPRVVIDTGRNGRGHASNPCSEWCNVRGAGVGHAPTLETPLPAVVDGYLWLKTPGESDGCTATLPDGAACPRYDSECGGLGSIGSRLGEPRAPEAGGLFEFQLHQLAENGDLSYGQPGSLLAHGVVTSAAPPLPPTQTQTQTQTRLGAAPSRLRPPPPPHAASNWAFASFKPFGWGSSSSNSPPPPPLPPPPPPAHASGSAGVAMSRAELARQRRSGGSGGGGGGGGGAPLLDGSLLLLCLAMRRAWGRTRGPCPCPCPSVLPASSRGEPDRIARAPIVPTPPPYTALRPRRCATRCVVPAASLHVAGCTRPALLFARAGARSQRRCCAGGCCAALAAPHGSARSPRRARGAAASRTRRSASRCRCTRRAGAAPLR